MVDEKLIIEAKRLLEKYKQIISNESFILQDWLKEFIVNKNINDNNSYNYTLLMATASIGEIYFAKLLLENGALVNCQNDSGETALIFAVKENNIEMVKLLLSFGADPNMKDEDGCSALDYARNRNYKEILDLLLGNHECEESNLEEEENLKEEVKRVIKL